MLKLEKVIRNTVEIVTLKKKKFDTNTSVPTEGKNQILFNHDIL
jgi:hypothetical protein